MPSDEMKTPSLSIFLFPGALTGIHYGRPLALKIHHSSQWPFTVNFPLGLFSQGEAATMPHLRWAAFCGSYLLFSCRDQPPHSYLFKWVKWIQIKVLISDCNVNGIFTTSSVLMVSLLFLSTNTLRRLNCWIAATYTRILWKQVSR